MIADLHCHYPMHLLEKETPPDTALKALIRVRKRPSWADKIRAALLLIAARLLNFRRFWGNWRVSLDGLEQGDVRLVFSVLYLPFAEMDIDEWPDGKPEDHYYEDLVRRLDQVETDLADADPEGKRHLVVKREQELDAVLASNHLVGFTHCVEGGFHLGADVKRIDERVAELAKRGVVYITLAHLFWRQVATNAPALPFLPDRLYDRIFPQQAGAGLSEIGEAAVRAMHKYGVLIDISHMRADAVDETFNLLEHLDGERGSGPSDFPVIATHAGFRFSDQSYMLEPTTIERIARRGGVIGLIMAQHQLNAGLSVRDPEDFDETKKTIRTHINEIRKHTRSNEYVGIGSDLDGFIKPTVGGIECARDLGRLRDFLGAAYPGDAEAILHGNAERVLRKALSGRKG